jgi:hypothetical protein
MLVLEIVTHFMKLMKLDLYITSPTESTQRSYKWGWDCFVSFFFQNDRPLPDWHDKDDYIIIFKYFIVCGWININLSELNIICSIISKKHQL